MKSLLLLLLPAALLLGCDCPGNVMIPSEPLYEGYVPRGDIDVTVTTGTECRSGTRVRVYVDGRPLYGTDRIHLPITFVVDTAVHRIDLWTVPVEPLAVADSNLAGDFSATLRFTRDTTVILPCP